MKKIKNEAIKKWIELIMIGLFGLLIQITENKEFILLYMIITIVISLKMLEVERDNLYKIHYGISFLTLEFIYALNINPTINNIKNILIHKDLSDIEKINQIINFNLPGMFFYGVIVFYIIRLISAWIDIYLYTDYPSSIRAL